MLDLLPTDLGLGRRLVGGAATGTVIGSFIGACVQVGVIIAAIPYIDANTMHAAFN